MNRSDVKNNLKIFNRFDPEEYTPFGISRTVDHLVSFRSDRGSKGSCLMNGFLHAEIIPKWNVFATLWGTSESMMSCSGFSIAFEKNIIKTLKAIEKNKTYC
eukprot:TRINITY_DN8865_c1_g1_i1.p1 TRINITY_DN8865_c1_g1~~TRINITY_DN8865_c1_g1_i1.p1  ORF type:complete len:102 (-),score=6.41 TRINITY_DN8865_c1_g1_i1:12-317(-)